ncbi:MAG: toxin-antitoxin system YwqK family antitoxin [Planctomycetota bacterium]
MLQRRRGSDHLPLVLVVTLSSTLIAWLGLGSRSATIAAATGPRAPEEVEPLVDAGVLAAPRDLEAWSSLASALAARALGAKHAAERVPVEDRAQPPLSELAESESVRVAWERASKQPLVEGEAEGSAPHGDWSIWRSDGTRAFAGRFAHGQPDGSWSWWHEGGAVRAEGTFLGGLLQGPWREYHVDGTLAVAWEYEAGLLEGPALEFWPDGVPKSEGFHDKGRRDGEWVTWHENGNLRARGAYVDGLRDGAWQEWHESGTSLLQATYELGRPEGQWREWYSNGQLKAQGQFVDGKREGAWTFFELDGGVDPRTGKYTRGIPSPD